MIYIFLAAAIGAATFSYLACNYSIASPAGKSEIFVFHNDRLWIRINNNPDNYGLIDSGTTTSMLPEHMVKDTSDMELASVSTAFGEKYMKLGKTPPIHVGDLPFTGEVLVGDLKYPIIGSDIIFSRRVVKISSQKLDWLSDNAITNAPNRGKILAVRNGTSANSPISHIHLMMMIDGSMKTVLLDTGYSGFLMAGAQAPKKPGLFPLIEIQRNSFGGSAMHLYNNREAKLDIVGDAVSINYRHYFNDISMETDFVIGGAFLKKYSITVDTVRGEYIITNS